LYIIIILLAPDIVIITIIDVLIINDQQKHVPQPHKPSVVHDVGDGDGYNSSQYIYILYYIPYLSMHN